MIIEVVFSLIFYWVLLLSAKIYVKLPMKRTEQGYEPLSRPVSERTFVLYVSLVHGAISTFLMFYGYFKYDHNPERPLHYMEEIAFSHTLGYMIYDMLAHYFCNALDIFIIWHHTAAGFMLIGMLLRPQGIYILCFTIGAAEITHPCHIARIMFDLTNVKKDSKLNVLNTFAFGIPFLLFRAILGTKHFYFGFTYRQGSIILKALSIASHSLGIDWCIQVFFLLWKMFPYLFKNSEIIENYAIWKRGREFMVMLTKDPKISAYFKSVEFSLTIGLPFVLSILYSPYGIY